jgi:hypothetical protein
VLRIIVGTGRHWVLDAIVGTLTVAVGSVAAWWLHRSRAPPPLPPPEPPARAIALAVGYALAIDFADALSSTRVSLTHSSPASIGIPLLIVLAALVAGDVDAPCRDPYGWQQYARQQSEPSRVQLAPFPGGCSLAILPPC